MSQRKTVAIALAALLGTAGCDGETSQEGRLSLFGGEAGDNAVTANGPTGLRLCNTTSSRVGVAVGYRDAKGWVSEGWWNVPSHGCEILLTGDLNARYYYVHAIDYDRGGEWAGAVSMCTDDKVFTIAGVDECSARGYRRTAFFEIDTGEERGWTVRLTDPAEAGPGDEAETQ